MTRNLLDVRDHPARGKGHTLLVEAAQARIAAAGMHKLRMRDVATDAGLAVGSVTYHFTGRRQLVMRALEGYVAAVEATVAGVRGQADQLRTRDTRLAALRGGVIAQYSDRRAVLLRAEMRVEAARDGAIAELSTRCHRAVTDLVNHLLVTAGSDGTPTDAVVALLTSAALTLSAAVPAERFASEMSTQVAAIINSAVRPLQKALTDEH